jgi:beta-galactosidase
MFRKDGKVLWNDGWRFSLNNKKDWRDVGIPHDWLIGNTRDLYQSGEGWYRKTFNLSGDDLKQSVEFGFDGVYMNCTVYVNDVKAFEWKNGYTPFYVDISEFIREGENTVTVSVLHESPNTRWYSGAGIYRNVWLIKQPKTHILSDGVYINANVNGEVKTEVAYTGDADITRQSILDAETHGLTVINPILWSPANPHLYTMKTELIKNNEVVDCVYNKFGFRETGFSHENGFTLNGERFKLHGVCQHHDLGALGAAFNIHAARRQLEILRGMGVNSIRTSHNPPAAELIELCDELGFLVVNEFSDMWELSKTEFDYARFFPEWYKRDVETWVKRDRNHPSVIMWSIGNEISDTHVSERGLEVARSLHSEILKHDPLGNAGITIGSNFMAGQNAQNVADFLKLAGYNYAENLYDEHYEKYPDWFFYGSETASTVRSRGVYHLPLDTALLTHDDKQCSDLGNSVVGWGKSNEGAWIADRDRDWCGGQYIWTGFDYIGEPTPYSTKNSYFGAVDTAGLPKASYYLYRAVWNKSAEPFVKLFPHWDWNEGQLIDVITYSNVERVELFLNNQSLGVRTVDLKKDDVLHAAWQVKYAQGELVAKAYGADGGVVATDVKRSFGEAASLELEEAVYGDLKFITVSAVDKDGVFVENARNRIAVSGNLLGIDNGDSTDYDGYRSNSRRLFSGQLVAIAKAKEELTFNFDTSESPARKIELSAERRSLDNNNPSVKVSAVILPENADYKEIEWKCVLDNGVVTNIAEAEAVAGGAVVTAKGDGGFRVRAYCMNGGEFPQIISELEFSVTGMGQATRSPYEFVSASFHTFCNKKLSIMGHGGVTGLSQGERNVIGFGGVNFGKTGSDKLTLHIGSESEFPVEVWLGNPDEAGAELISTVGFGNNHQWHDYKPQEFTLSRRIAGVHMLCFVVNDKCIFGGFEFTKDSLGRIDAASCDNIYGDNYEVAGNYVTKIGNNVFLEFNGMDFGETGVTRVTINGRTPNAVNSIRLSYGEDSQMLEFRQSGEYIEQAFTLKKITGKQDISFVFLPGSSFDFAWFKFDE